MSEVYSQAFQQLVNLIQSGATQGEVPEVVYIEESDDEYFSCSEEETQIAVKCDCESDDEYSVSESGCDNIACSK